MYEIPTKQDFYKLSRKLLLGNILVNWKWEEFEQIFLNTPETLPKICGVRHVRKAFTNKGNSGLLPRVEAYQYGLDTPDKENLLFDEGAIHDHLTIQGEVMTDEQGLCLRYSHLQTHQRTLWYIAQNGIVGLRKFQLPHNMEILTTEQRAGTANDVVKYARGLKASAILQKYMDDLSWGILNEILGCQMGETNTYGDPLLNFTFPVVEFASFDKPVGVLGHNSLIWEVRTNY